MKTKKDYSDRNTPYFDAVEDVKDYFGARWTKVSAIMGRIKDPYGFQACANFAGLEGFPVEAWYELYHGGGSWAKAIKATECPTCHGLGEQLTDEAQVVGCPECNGLGRRALP